MSNPGLVHFFEGYAVISADGFIADAKGDMPGSLKFDADWAYFQRALDRADVTLIGRHTHEAAPNVKGRQRLVFSRRMPELVREDESTLWIDPAKVDPSAAMAELFGRICHVAVVGGQGVFDWVMSGPGFSEVHLSVAQRVRLGRGHRMFSEASDLEAVFSHLAAQGMILHRRAWLDKAEDLELLVYRRR